MRLASFYYGDQISLLLALQDLRAFRTNEYKNDIGWIDVHHSSLINLSLDLNPLVYYPKGKGISEDKL